jgi:hypothetical protein
MDDFDTLLEQALKYPKPDVIQTQYKPPEEIFHVLHLAEAAGIDIPEIVDVWWEKETIAGCKS